MEKNVTQISQSYLTPSDAAHDSFTDAAAAVAAEASIGLEQGDLMVL